ncbi:MAG: hypothetical protein WDZ37_00975 [Solirubrobacterales bacterium]
MSTPTHIELSDFFGETHGVLSPPWVEDTSDYEFFGVNINDTRAFAAQALTRRLKVIGLPQAA